MDKRKIERWFLAHKGSNTNEVIAAALAGDGIPNLPVETQAMIYKNKKFQLWEVDYSLIEQIQESKKQFHLMFRVFRQRTSGGKLEEWFFHKQKRSYRKTTMAKK